MYRKHVDSRSAHALQTRKEIAIEPHMVSKVLLAHEMAARKQSVCPAPIVDDTKEILREKLSNKIPIVIADLA